MKKLAVTLVLALPLACAISDGKARAQAFPGLPIYEMYKLAFESGSRGPVTDGAGGVVQMNGEISIIDDSNAKPRRFASGDAPAWSPDGKSLAFCSRDGRGLGQIQVINDNGSGQTQITHLKGGACFPDWSPDGEKIAITAYGGKTPVIQIIDKNGENGRTITEGYGPRWSPDGKRLVYYRSLESARIGSAIWVVNSNGTEARKIVEETRLPPTWVTGRQARFLDSNRIIFSSGRERFWKVFCVNLDGTGLEVFAEGDGFELFDPVVSPDGRQLVARGVTERAPGMARMTEIAILMLELPSKKWTRLANGTNPAVVWKLSTPRDSIIPDMQSSAPMTSTDQSLIAKGRERYLAFKCDECHGANGEGGGDGPDLVGTRLNAEEISKFLEKPSPDAYMKGMPNIPANHPDHQALVAYVLSLKRPSDPK